jgi:4-amino-4-deoxy-L-arabinose transferase-like glycosyltransferase
VAAPVCRVKNATMPAQGNHLQLQHAKRCSPLTYLSGLAIVLSAGIGMLTLAWVGYVGSDDHSYARGALAWLHDFPYVGDDHWTLRHPVVLPIAASLALFGFREASLGVPSAVFFLLFLAVTYRYLYRFCDVQFALLTSLFLATTPLFAVQATFPQTTIIEMLAVSLSFWLFYDATGRERPGWPLFGVGVAAALGFLTRETTAGILIFYGMLCVLGFGVPRRAFGIIALGFALLVGLEIAYFSILRGDPLYRYRIDLFHDAVDRAAEMTAALRSSSALNAEGNLSVRPFLEPALALLFNQEFGLIFWAVLPAALWVCYANPIPRQDRQLLLLLIGLGCIWTTFISLNTSVLYVVPRYYAVSTWAAIIVIVYWLRYGLSIWRPSLAILVGAGLVTINLLCIYVENKNPLFAERALVKYVVRHGGSVYTDPMTRTRAKLLLEFAGVSDRVFSGPVPPGAVFFANRKSIERCQLSGASCRWAWKDFLPRASWIELARIEPARKWSGRALSWLGLDKLLPRAIFERLDRPNPGGVFYLTAPAGHEAGELAAGPRRSSRATDAP